MTKLQVGYTGFFGWPAIYCRILEIKDGWLKVELEDGQHGVIRESDFKPVYRHGAGQEVLLETLNQAAEDNGEPL